jgi:hypothetical protein
VRQAEEKLRAGSLYSDQGLVFAGVGGGLINPSNLRQRSFTPLLEHADLPRIAFNDLRHTCASLLFQKNVHPKFVQELLGHASVAITLDTYSHMLPGMGSETADAIGEALSYLRVATPLLHPGPGVTSGPSSRAYTFPANCHFLNVGDAGFEPATSSL